MKKLTALLLIVLTVLLLAVPVSANSPGPGFFCRFDFKNLPEGTVYVDLLIKLSEDDVAYQALNKHNLPKGVSEAAPIAIYAEDGYCSHSLHYEGASAMMEPEDGYAVVYDHTLTHLRASGKADQLKLAMVDANGAVLQVSAPHSFQSKSKLIFMELAGEVYYDAQADTLSVPEQVSVSFIVVFVLLSLAGMVLTLFVESVVSWAFGFKGKISKLILMTNLVSQLLMRLVDFLIRGLIGFNYLYMVLILEVFVYAGEFLVYRKKMTGISWKRCLLYTVAANTASLVLGLWMFRILF